MFVVLKLKIQLIFIVHVITESPVNMSGQTRPSLVKTSNLLGKCQMTGTNLQA